MVLLTERAVFYTLCCKVSTVHIFEDRWNIKEECSTITCIEWVVSLRDAIIVCESVVITISRPIVCSMYDMKDAGIGQDEINLALSIGKQSLIRSSASMGFVRYHQLL